MKTTTFCLIPLLKKYIDAPIIAAGGIATGAQILSSMILGAEGVQIGSLFAATEEASSHTNFKERILATQEGDTLLTLKEVAAVRMIKNELFHKIQEAYQRKADLSEIEEILGKGRSKLGMFEGDMVEGKLEIGQSAYLIDELLPVSQVFQKLLQEFEEAKTQCEKL